MNMKTLIAAGLTATLLSTGGSFAQTAPAGETVRVMVQNQEMMDTEAVRARVEELAAQGYTYIEVGRTFLGRARIRAYNGTEMREIVMNAATGEVMREMAEHHEGLPGEEHQNGEGHGEGEQHMDGEGEEHMNGEGGMGDHGAEGSMGGSAGGSMGGSTGGSTGGSMGGSAGGSMGGSTGGSMGGSMGGNAGGSMGGSMGGGN